MIAFGLQHEGAFMRGSDEGTGSLFCSVDIDEKVPTSHPLRLIKTIVDDAL